MRPTTACLLRYLLLLLPLLSIVGSLAPVHPASAQTISAASYSVALPLVVGEPLPLSPFGFDVRDYARDDVLAFAAEASPRWVRAGDILWSDVEREPGVYNWEALAGVEANVRRLRQLGFEPTVVVQRSPHWAQREPGRLCSPPKPEAVGSFVNFMGALAARYSSGPTAITFWEIWNEPDYASYEVQDIQGLGCWRNDGLPYRGGFYYGQVLQQVYPAMKAANPHATVLAGAFAYEMASEAVTLEFFTGMLVSGAGHSFDVLSFHSYGEALAGDLLVTKSLRLRAILAAYGQPNKPLFATETSATCFSLRDGSSTYCPQSFMIDQANYAARIFAQAIALDLYGALWFSLVGADPVFLGNAQLIDDQNGTLIPRPAFYAFRNSAKLLRGARYTGTPLTEPPPAAVNQVQLLQFRKGQNQLYVYWVPETRFPLPADIAVPPGSTAICTQQLNRETPSTFYCSDTDGDGLIPIGINELPQYVEVLAS
jgi:hypothetical protein